MKSTDTSLSIDTLWERFSQNYSLTQEQTTQFKNYYTLCKEWNEHISNLTTITQLPQFIESHLEDSLSLSRSLDLAKHVHTLADIGTGAGFPAIPLKIIFPHLSLYLIEVTAKKRDFLARVCAELGLTSVHLIDLDWRTFLRTTSFSIDLFCSRAALAPQELIRMFKPSSPYAHATLVYWAGKEWIASAEEKTYILREYNYLLGTKKRRLVFFTNPKAERSIL